MAHFIGRVQGNRGEASRLGSKDSGMDATARGWRIGGSVYCFHQDADKTNGIEEKDVVRFDLDGGSTHRSGFVIAEFEEKEGKISIRSLLSREEIEKKLEERNSR